MAWSLTAGGRGALAATLPEQYIVGPDPDQHADRIREVEQLGATVVCLQNASGADPVGAFEVYGERVLPALRGVRA